MKEENHEVKIEVEEENPEMKIEVEEENPEMKIEVEEENHQTKIEEENENPEMKIEVEENHETKIEEENEDPEMKIEVKEENRETKIEVKQPENMEVKVEEHQDPEPDLHPLNTTTRTIPAASSGPPDLQNMWEEKTCPMCWCSIMHLGKHLKGRHRLLNSKERQILTQWGSGRINIRRCQCPVPACGYLPGKHLDRHLMSYHKELSLEDRRRMLNHVRGLRAMQMLAELRKSNPLPPMVSRLDQEELELPELQQPGLVSNSDTPLPGCGMAVCAQTILSYRNRLQKVEKEKKELVAQVQHLQRGLSVSKRVIAGLRKSGAVAINQPVLRSSKRKRAQVPQGAGQASAPKKAAPPLVDRTPGPATVSASARYEFRRWAKSASPAERRTKVSSTVVS